MKICLITSSFPANATDVIQAPFLTGVISELARRGHSIIVYTHEKPGVADNFEGCRVERFVWSRFSGRTSNLTARPFRNFGLIVLYFLKGALGLRTLQTREKFDAILCCWAIPSGLLVRLAAFLAKMPPYAVWALGSDINELKSGPLGRAVLRWVLRGAGARFADGLKLAGDARRISNCECEFMPTFRSLGGDITIPASTGSKNFLFVGRHERVKGVDILIEALILLRKKRPDLHFAAEIVGEGCLTHKLSARVSKEGMAPEIRFPGKVGTSALIGFYQAAHCVVIPSRTESIPLVMGEAIQFHRPVIVTDVGDMGYLVREFGLGRVVARSEAQLMAAALELYLSRAEESASPRWQEALEFISMEKSMPALIRGLEGMADVQCA